MRRGASRPRPGAEHCTREPITGRRAAPPRAAPVTASGGRTGPPGPRAPAHLPGAHLGGAHSAVSAPPRRRAESPGSPGDEGTGKGALSSRGRALRPPQPDLRPGLTCTRRSGKRPRWSPSSPRRQPRAGPSHTCRTTSPGARLSSSSFCARSPARTSISAGGGRGGGAVQKGPVGAYGPRRESRAPCRGKRENARVV